MRAWAARGVEEEAAMAPARLHWKESSDWGGSGAETAQVAAAWAAVAHSAEVLRAAAWAATAG